MKYRKLVVRSRPLHLMQVRQMEIISCAQLEVYCEKRKVKRFMKYWKYIDISGF